MAKVPESKSRGQNSLKVFTFGKAVHFHLGHLYSETPDRICFSDGVPVAIVTGGYLYIQDTYRSRSVMAHIAKFQEAAETGIEVRIDPDGFDFVLGSVLSKTALPLTRRPKSEN